MKNSKLVSYIRECIKEVLKEEDVKLSSSLNKSITKLKDLYLKKQTLIKAFKDANTTPEKKEDIKKALIVLAKQIKAQEEVFGSKVKDEPIEGGEDD